MIWALTSRSSESRATLSHTRTHEMADDSESLLSSPPPQQYQSRMSQPPATFGSPTAYTLGTSAAARALGGTPSGSFRSRPSPDANTSNSSDEYHGGTGSGGSGNGDASAAAAASAAVPSSSRASRVIRVGENEDGALIIESNSNNDISMFATSSNQQRRRVTPRSNSINNYSARYHDGKGRYLPEYDDDDARCCPCVSDKDYCNQLVERRYFYCSIVLSLVLFIIAATALVVGILSEAHWLLQKEQSLNVTIVETQSSVASLQGRIVTLEQTVASIETQMATLAQQLAQLANATLPHDGL